MVVVGNPTTTNDVADAEVITMPAWTPVKEETRVSVAVSVYGARVFSVALKVWTPLSLAV